MLRICQWFLSEVKATGRPCVATLAYKSSSHYVHKRVLCVCVCVAQQQKNVSGEKVCGPKMSARARRKLVARQAACRGLSCSPKCLRNPTLERFSEEKFRAVSQKSGFRAGITGAGQKVILSLSLFLFLSLTHTPNNTTMNETLWRL